MEHLLSRFRNLLVLGLVVVAQLVLLGLQVKDQQNVRLIRVWTVSAVTPLAAALESTRSGVFGFLKQYVVLRDLRAENDQLREEVSQLRLRNQDLERTLGTAERAQALLAFQKTLPSTTVAARIIGTNAAPDARVVFIDRGTRDGVRAGMAAVTSLGVVGRILDSYPSSAQLMMINDPSFAMGVIGQNSRVLGTLKGQGRSTCIVEYVDAHLRVEVGDRFFTSGDDRVFPRGLPAGIVTEVDSGQVFKEIRVEPIGLRAGLDEVLVVLEPVHQEVPEPGEELPPVELAPRPATAIEESVLRPEAEAEFEQSTVAGEDSPPTDANLVVQPRYAATDADKLRKRYQRIGEAQDHTFGEGIPGSKPPDFNAPLPAVSSSPPETTTDNDDGSDRSQTPEGRESPQ
jgi:rod shape-determining protein MreC